MSRLAAAQTAALQSRHSNNRPLTCWTPPPCSLPQDPALPSFAWSARLKALMPWLSTFSPTLSLGLRTSIIRQSMYVAYARHDAVSGEPQAREVGRQGVKV